MPEIGIGTIWTVIVAIAGTGIALASFSLALFRHGKDIRKLNEIEQMSKLFALADAMKNASVQFGQASQLYSSASKSITEINDKFRETSNHFSETHGALRQTLEQLAKLTEEQSNTSAKIDSAADGIRKLIAAENARRAQESAETRIQAQIQEHPQPSNTERHIADLDTLFSDIKSKWDEFIAFFRSRVAQNQSIVWDGRAVGQIAYELADGRRRHPIAIELADQIADLHGRFRSYSLRQAIKEEWLTQELRDEFVTQANQAIAALDQS